VAPKLPVVNQRPETGRYKTITIFIVVIGEIVRKNVFIKDKISADKDFSTFNIKQHIPFNASFISNTNTFSRS